MSKITELTIQKKDFAVRHHGHRTHVHVHDLKSKDQIELHFYDREYGHTNDACLSFKTDEASANFYVSDMEFLRGLRDFLTEKLEKMESK